MTVISENRKPLIILAIIGLVVVVLYITGAAGAVHGGGSGGGWQDRLGGVSLGGAQLRTDDLVTDGTGCQLAASSIVVTNTCAMTVSPVPGRFSVSRVTRKALLSATPPVHLVVTVSGQQIEKDVKAGDQVKVSFGKDGGRLDVACSTPLVPTCVISLTKDGA